MNNLKGGEGGGGGGGREKSSIATFNVTPTADIDVYAEGLNHHR